MLFTNDPNNYIRNILYGWWFQISLTCCLLNLNFDLKNSRKYNMHSSNSLICCPLNLNFDLKKSRKYNMHSSNSLTCCPSQFSPQKQSQIQYEFQSISLHIKDLIKIDKKYLFMMALTIKIQLLQAKLQFMLSSLSSIYIRYVNSLI